MVIHPAEGAARPFANAIHNAIDNAIDYANDDVIQKLIPSPYLRAGTGDG